MNKIKLLSIGLITFALSACSGESKLEAKEKSTELASAQSTKVEQASQVAFEGADVLLGVDYKELEIPVNIEGLENNSLLEIFWLGCPHCQKFEPGVRKWKANNPDVNFVKMHAMTNNPRWLIDSTLYNSLIMVGGTEEHTNALFDIYTKKMNDYQKAPSDAKPKPYPTIKEVYDFVESQGLDLEAFQSKMSSDEMKEIQARDAQVFTDSKLGGVPAFIVNGKYMITGKDVRSYDEYFEKVSAVLKKTNK